MGYASESSPFSSRCTRSDTTEMKAAVEWKKDWHQNSGIAENCPLIFLMNPLKCFLDLREIVETEPQQF